MNELQYIRAQVALERGHMASVRLACQQALALPEGALPPAELADFCTCCAQYLVFIGRRFNAQDQAHADQLRAVPGVTADPAHAALLSDLDATLARNRRALETLAAALGSAAIGSAAIGSAAIEPVADTPSGEVIVAACREYLAFYEATLAPRRHGLAPLLEAHYGIAQWRRASQVTADAVMRERELYAQATGRLPAGVKLPSEAERAAARRGVGSNCDAAAGAAQRAAADCGSSSP